MSTMVGNEEATITRMLESVAPHISYWVVQCNGSDNTKKIIVDFFLSKGIQGEVYEVEWNFPGWNRDHLLQKTLKASHGCEWILRMDADERLQIDEDFDWNILKDTTVDSYNVAAHAGDTKYFRTWLWNAKLPWFFAHDKRHETIHLPQIGENFQRETLPFSFRHLVSQDGNTWFAPRKFLRDALELEIDKVVGNTVLDDAYHLWYIAKSYADCYGKPEELAFGKKHSDEYARRSIWYYDRFLEHTNALNEKNEANRQDEMCYFAFIIMGNAYFFMNETQKGIEHINLAHQFSPSRNESHLYLALNYENLGMFDECLEEIEFMMKPGRNNVFPNLSFLIEDRAYLDTSNFLKIFKERIESKKDISIIDSESFTFDVG